MTNLLSRLFGRAKKGSGATAKDRLRFVLQHDRINLPPERMEEMKSEILAVIVKYLVVDKDRVEIDLEQRDRRHSKLVAEIPVAIHTPPSNSKQITDSSALADVAESNGANNGSDAELADDDSEDEAAKPEAPKAAVEAKADEGEDEEDKKA